MLMASSFFKLFQRNSLCNSLKYVLVTRKSQRLSSTLRFENSGLTVGGSFYHPTWLRHNCQCPECISTSGQKTIQYSEIHPSVVIESATISDNQLQLAWSSGHRGYIELDWLEQIKQDKATKESFDINPKTTTELPVVSGAGMIDSKEKQWQWLHNLNEYGVCLLTDLPESKEMMELAQTMYNAQSTIYGEKFDVVAKEDDIINIAYSSVQLDLHMDLTYYESPPGLQLLHCLKFDDCVVGGESVLLDLFAVVEEMRVKHPQHFNTLARVPATFQKVHYQREQPVNMVAQIPHIELDNSEKVIGMSWSPPFEGPLDVPRGDVQPYYEARYCLSDMIHKSKLKITHRLRPGELISFNNRRCLHGRAEFKLNGGERHLGGVYVNIDHFKSAYQVLCNQLGKTLPATRVFNKQSF